MKRSKWCKYCNLSPDTCVKGINDYNPCSEGPNWDYKNISAMMHAYKMQSYRDWLAKTIKFSRKVHNQLGTLYSKHKTDIIVECARMLDPEKSARVASRVQEIKEWRAAMKRGKVCPRCGQRTGLTIKQRRNLL